MRKRLLALVFSSLLFCSVCSASDHYVASNDQGHWYLQTETVKSQKTNVNVWLTYWTKTVSEDGSYVKVETQVLLSNSGPHMYKFNLYQYYDNSNNLLNQETASNEWPELYPNTLGWSICNLAAKLVYTGGV